MNAAARKRQVDERRGCLVALIYILKHDASRFMMIKDYLDLMIEDAKSFLQEDVQDVMFKNNHMHKGQNDIPIEDIKAILTCYLNHAAGKRNVDLALYSKDLPSPLQRIKNP